MVDRNRDHYLFRADTFQASLEGVPYEEIGYLMERLALSGIPSGTEFETLDDVRKAVENAEA